MFYPSEVNRDQQYRCQRRHLHLGRDLQEILYRDINRIVAVCPTCGDDDLDPIYWRAQLDEQRRD
jgi:hypothetical protein